MLGFILMLLFGLTFLHGDVVEVEAWKKKSPSDITDLLSIQERLRELLPDAGPSPNPKRA